MDHRQVDDALDAGLAREVQRDEGLRHFVGRHGVQQEQRARRRQRLAQRGDIGEVAHHLADARREALLARSADEGLDLRARGGQPLDDEGTDGARGTGDENGHGNLLMS